MFLYVFYKHVFAIEYFARGRCCLAKTEFFSVCVFTWANWQFAWFPYFIWVPQQIIDIR